MRCEHDEARLAGPVYLVKVPHPNGGSERYMPYDLRPLCTECYEAHGRPMAVYVMWPKDDGGYILQMGWDEKVPS